MLPIPFSERFFSWALGWVHGYGLYVTKLSLRLWPNGIATYDGKTDGGTEGASDVALNRDQVLLVVLSLADGHALTPVQIQKSLFLADDRAGAAFRTRYNFQPYDYGPFDKQVYLDAQALSLDGLVEIGTDRRGGWNTYAATPEGVREGRILQDRLAEPELTMLTRIVNLVRSLSFTDLVSAIYRSYPHMRERSVFRD